MQWNGDDDDEAGLGSAPREANEIRGHAMQGVRGREPMGARGLTSFDLRVERYPNFRDRHGHFGHR